MNVAILFHFCVNDTSCERVPLLFGRRCLFVCEWVERASAIKIKPFSG
jgi:hypothetical protein